MLRLSILPTTFLFLKLSFAQQYSGSNIHSHNNYAQPIVFWQAYNLQYGSIEADVFLSADSNNLWVAHTADSFKAVRRSLDDLYLQPLVNCIKKNDGFIYNDHSKKLQLMIDVKSEAVATLNQLIKMIRKYPELTHTATLKFVISGNRPNAEKFSSYPSFIWFDGIAEKLYTKKQLKKIAMISAPLTRYTLWNATTPISSKEEKNITAVIKKVHAFKKPLRFWDTPDNENSWKQLMQWKVDFINTDHVPEAAAYLKLQ